MNLTVKDVFLALWHSILLIVIVSIIGMVTFGGFTYCFVNPKYTATAKLYVYNEKNDERYITTGDLTVSYTAESKSFIFSIRKACKRFSS